MIAFMVLLGVVAFILYRFKAELQEGYAYAGRAAAPLRSKVLPVPPALSGYSSKVFSILSTTRRVG